jgi:hypothetical protein
MIAMTPSLNASNRFLPINSPYLQTVYQNSTLPLCNRKRLRAIPTSFSIWANGTAST